MRTVCVWLQAAWKKNFCQNRANCLTKHIKCVKIFKHQLYAGVMELADVTDSKSVGVTLVRVRPPPPAPELSPRGQKKFSQQCGDFFLCHFWGIFFPYEYCAESAYAELFPIGERLIFICSVNPVNLQLLAGKLFLLAGKFF